MQTVLCGLQSPINIGMLLRSAEVYGSEVIIVDTFAALRGSEAERTASDFACGAWQRGGHRIESDYGFLSALRGRMVCAADEGSAVPLPDFSWRPDDVLLLGNEYTGVPPLVSARAAVSVRVPMPGRHLPKPPSFAPIDPERAGTIPNAGMPSLNVAVAGSILLADAYMRARPQARASTA
jgi:tRNA (cytidine/uridine-2'-O-)-methyltransferase